MGAFTVAFFGHKHIEDPHELEKCLDDHILWLLTKKEFVKFLVGRDGDFDQLAATAVRRMRNQYRADNSALALMIPDLTPDYIDNVDSAENCYTEIEVCIPATMVRPKYMIQTRNQEMIEKSDLILCYITHESPVAWKTVQHAILQGKMVINLAEAGASTVLKEQYKDILNAKKPLKIES